MTNTEELKRIIEESGLRKGFIAKQLGLTTYGFKRKVENESQFKAEEIQKLCEVLNITSLKKKDDIFFNENVDKTPT